MRCNNSHNLFVVKQECRRIVLKGKGSFYIAQYPVRWTAQSALYFVALVFTVTHIVQSMRIIFLLFYILTSQILL